LDFLNQYSARISPEPNSGCWLWTGQVNQYGYGRIRFPDGRTKVAHRVSFESEHGDVPEPMQLDHLCRVRCCVNPDHLEIVTRLENVRRAVAHRRGNDLSRCASGHELTGDNRQLRKDGKRKKVVCRECARASRLKWNATEQGIKSLSECRARYELKLKLKCNA
jgi:hypothetical protein